MYNNSLKKGTILRGSSYSYEIVNTLGQGSFGITYLAKVRMEGSLGTIQSNMFVAIKEFFMREINGREGTTVTSGSKGGLFDDYRRKFVREAMNLSKLSHPNIIKVVEAFEANNTCYYVMEYIEGNTLNEYIATQNGMSEYDALLCILKVSEAIKFMHRNKMLHLDVKPLNVMRRSTGEFILIDFGLSKQFDRDGEPESTTRIGGGTMGYAPLEQHCYKRGAGFPATLDIYALGATLYKCITATTPPEASTVLNEGLPIEMLKKCGASDKTIRLIENAMEPAARRRIQSVDDFISIIDEIMPHANHVNIYSKEELKSGKTKTRKDKYDDDNAQSLEIRWKWPYNVDERVKDEVRSFISGMKKCTSGCLMCNVSVSTYANIMQEKTNEQGVIKLRIHKILSFIDELQRLTGLHWRLPEYEELLETFDSEIRRQTGKYYLYYSPKDVSFHRYEPYFAVDETIDSVNYDYYFASYYCTLVLDPLKADRIQTSESYSISSNREYTCFIVDEKGKWSFGFCPVKFKNKWGVIDKFGNFVIEYLFDEAPEIGFTDYARGGCSVNQDLLLRYHKGDKIGYYRVLPNGKGFEFEIECSIEEWKAREEWT